MLCVQQSLLLLASQPLLNNTCNDQVQSGLRKFRLILFSKIFSLLFEQFFRDLYSMTPFDLTIFLCFFLLLFYGCIIKEKNTRAFWSIYFASSTNGVIFSYWTIYSELMRMM